MSILTVTLAGITVVSICMSYYMAWHEVTAKKATKTMFLGTFWPIFMVRLAFGFLWAVYRYLSKKG